MCVCVRDMRLAIAWLACLLRHIGIGEQNVHIDVHFYCGHVRPWWQIAHFGAWVQGKNTRSELNSLWWLNHDQRSLYDTRYDMQTTASMLHGICCMLNVWPIPDVCECARARARACVCGSLSNRVLHRRYTLSLALSLYRRGSINFNQLMDECIYW